MHSKVIISRKKIKNIVKECVSLTIAQIFLIIRTVKGRIVSYLCDESHF